MKLPNEAKWGLAAVLMALVATMSVMLWSSGGSQEGATGIEQPAAPQATAEKPEFNEFEGDAEPVAEQESDSEATKASEDGDEAAEEVAEEAAEETASVDQKAEVAEQARERVLVAKKSATEWAEQERRRVRPGQQTNSNQERPSYDPAVLRIVTNFDKADVTVNGMPYPEYTEAGEEPGMVLPAGGPYTVQVTYDGKTKSYTISLKPFEHRMLMVELSGFKGGNVAPSPAPARANINRQNNQQDEDSGTGRVTVYSKPKGTIFVDGGPRKQKTPGTVKVPAGRHDIQVEFQGGDMSESKTVRVREGSRIKLFFRKRE